MARHEQNNSQVKKRQPRQYLWLAILPLLIWIFCFYQIFFAPHLVVIWLQNSDEIRATGGFLGSVVWLEMRGGWPTDFRLRDIYELGGKMTTYVEPPLPIKKYLAGGGAWRIQDVNWDRDFALSAARFSNFLARSEIDSPKKSADLIMAVNLSLVEKFFDQIGGVEITDKQGQKTFLTSENFAILARARRPRQDQLDFPKMDLLRAAAHAAARKFLALPNKEKLNLINWGLTQIQSGEVQFYSPHYLLERFFATQKIAGLLTTRPAIPSAHDLYLIDSNVGVNKVNRFITRTEKLTFNASSQSATLKINWQNNCQPDIMADLTEASCTYANYFRLLLDPQLTPLFPTDTLDVKIITDSQNQTWQEIGWLILTPPESSSTATLNFATTYDTLEIH